MPANPIRPSIVADVVVWWSELNRSLVRNNSGLVAHHRDWCQLDTVQADRLESKEE